MKFFIALAIVLGCELGAILSQSECDEVRGSPYLKAEIGSRCKTFFFCNGMGRGKEVHIFKQMCAEGSWFDEETQYCSFESEEQCPDATPRDPTVKGGRGYRVKGNDCTMWLQDTIDREYENYCNSENALCFSNSKLDCVHCDEMTEEDLAACDYNTPQ